MIEYRYTIRRSAYYRDPECLTREEAKALHENQKFYTVNAYRDGVLSHSIRVSPADIYVALSIFDEKEREVLVYVFGENSEGFRLDTAFLYDYVELDLGVKRKKWEVDFKEEGRCQMRRITDFGQETPVKIEECVQPFSLRGHEEQFPSFGEYSSIERIDRGQDWLDFLLNESLSFRKLFEKWVPN